MSVQHTNDVDPERLDALVGNILGDLGGAFAVPLVRIGDRLGLYRHLHEGVALTGEELAERANIAPRYAREWLAAQAASGYVTYDPDDVTLHSGAAPRVPATYEIDWTAASVPCLAGDGD